MIGQHRQSALGDGGNLTASLSKAAAQRYSKARIAPLSFISSLMVLNTAEHLFSGRCSQKSLLLQTKEFVGRTREEKGALRSASSMPRGSVFHVAELHAKSK